MRLCGSAEMESAHGDARKLGTVVKHMGRLMLKNYFFGSLNAFNEGIIPEPESQV